MNHLTPRQIVAELDRYIIGQQDAKRAVAIALRNRWRRQQVPEGMREEITPKNILMIGPTGCGKTEIARRLSRLAEAPFLKVEATKFTEVGYVGRDVESIIRDLLEVSFNMVRSRKHEEVIVKAQQHAEERVLDALVGDQASPETRQKFRDKLKAGKINDSEIELEVNDTSNPMMSMDVPGMPGSHVGMINIGDMIGKAFGGRTKKRKLTVKEAMEILKEEESEKLIDQEVMTMEAISLAENHGIVFIDEIDKIAVREDGARGGEVSREGVQRDLLPLLEGTTVHTKHGMICTDYILFITSGAFHMAKPSDLLPELQGRLPIRVELNPLTKEDMVRILTEPEASLTKQYIALMATEQVSVSFGDDAIEEIALLAAKVNSEIENIGARRLHTIMEKLMEDISFSASERPGEIVGIDAAYVREHVTNIAEKGDLSKFIL